MKLKQVAALSLIICVALAVGAKASQDITIGVLEDLSGPYSDIGGKGTVSAARLAVEDAAKLGISTKVNILVADHQNKPDIGSLIVRKWLDEGVHAVFGASNSGVALAVQNLTRERRKLFAFTAVGADLTGKSCSPYGSAWNIDTFSVATVVGKALTEQGAQKWFIIAADYAFGHQLQRDLTEAVSANGGQVIGAVRHPLNTADFASFLLQAQSSGADVVAFANAGKDLTTSVQQAKEFGIAPKQKIAALIIFPPDIRSLGLPVAQGILHVTGFRWDKTDRSKAFSARFAAIEGRPPTELQASMYSAVLHYLKATAATGEYEGDRTAQAFRNLRVSDDLIGEARIREDGRVLKELELVAVKSPASSKSDWDLVEPISVISGEQGFRPEVGSCK